MKRKILFTIGLVILLIFSCTPEQPGPEGSLSISTQDQMNMSIVPDIDMELETIRLTITGPGDYNEVFELTPGEGILVEELLFGEYTIIADGLNAEAELIGNDSATVQVNNGEVTPVSLCIRPVSGSGVLDLDVSWPEGLVQFPDLQAALTDSGGVTTVIDFDYEGAKATAAPELANGYYSLCIALYDGNFLCYGRMEIVRIVTGQTTHADFEFSEININSGSLEINIDIEMNNPLHPSITGSAAWLGTDEPLVLQAAEQESLPGTVYAWYVSGVAVATGETYTFSSAETGIYRIDLAAFTADGSRAGSTGFDVHVSEENPNYTSISSVQGAGHSSPLVGQTVEDVYGVITATENKGFWMQSPRPDNDPATSEGMYVYTYTVHSFQVGDLVLVDGTVLEYGKDNELKLTELNYVTVEVLQSGYQLPEPVLIGPDGILPPEIICNDAADTVYNSIFDPDEDAIDFFESLESMLVQVQAPVAVGGTKYGEIPTIPAGAVYSQTTPRGGIYLSGTNANGQILHIDTDSYILGLDPLGADIGDYFEADVCGVIGYSYGKFLVLPTVLPGLVKNTVAKETTTLASGTDMLSIATFNVENFPRDDENMSSAEVEAKIADIALSIAEGLNGPDIVGIQEMMDDSYDADDGTVTAEANFTALTDSISAQGGPSYEFLEIEPFDNEEGGWPGANIRVGFLYNPARVGFVQAGSPSNLVETEVVDNGSGPELTVNPGRFSQDSFAGSRRPLIAQFSFNGEKVFVINNHLCSKGGDTALFGEAQPPVLESEAERLVQAEAVADMIASITALDAQANIIVVGDLNDFQFSPPLAVLESAGMQSLTKTLLPENEQYSYIYNGNSQQLDHILASPALMQDVQVDIVHRNAGYDSETRETDHDPIHAVFGIGTAPEPGTLLISEYGEGSSYNKYIELYNPGSSAVSLDGFTLSMYANGGSDPNTVLALSGTLDAENTYVIAHSQADDAGLLPLADITSGVTNFNGNDCLILKNTAGDIIDQIGICGFDPGSSWPVASSGSTANHTLVRKAGITQGNSGDWDSSAGTDDDNSEWIVYPSDYWDSVGLR